MKHSIKQVNEQGQGLVEYALILVLVSIVAMVGLFLLGPSIGNIFSSVNSTLTAFGGSGGGSESGGAVALDPNVEQDFGSTQWKNGFDQATPVNNFCTSEGSGTGYNFYSIDGGGYTYYIASGQPWTGSGSTFMHTGTCP